MDIFTKSKKPMDAESVYRKLAGKNFDQATIYRTLTAFEKSGILKKVDLRKDSAHFELADEHHHHIVCTSCDAVEDFENKELEKVLAKVKLSKFKNIKEHSLEFFGLCRVCLPT